MDLLVFMWRESKVVPVQAMKAYAGGVTANAVFTSTLDGGEWSASRPDRFTLGRRNGGSH